MRIQHENQETEMRTRDKLKYGVAGAAMLVAATAALLTTGWGQAAAATATHVFVTNKGASQAVPIHEQGTANVDLTIPAGSGYWRQHNLASPNSGALIFNSATGASTVAISSLTTLDISGGSTVMELVLYSGLNCTGGSSVVLSVAPPPSGTLHQEFPIPLVVSLGASGSLCAIAPTNSSVVEFVGYYY